MKESGQIVLFRFPRADLSEGKLRPALLLSEVPGPYEDWLKVGSRKGKGRSAEDEQIENCGGAGRRSVRAQRRRSGIPGVHRRTAAPGPRAMGLLPDAFGEGVEETRESSLSNSWERRAVMEG